MIAEIEKALGLVGKVIPDMAILVADVHNVLQLPDALAHHRGEVLQTELGSDVRRGERLLRQLTKGEGACSLE